MKKLILLCILISIFVPTSIGYKIGDINQDNSIDISDVVSLFNYRDVPLDDGDFNCDNSIDISDVIYLFKNYDKFRSSVVFAKNFQMEPHWDEGYCYVVDADGNKFITLKEGATAPSITDAKIVSIPLKNVVTGDQILLGTAYITKDDNITNSIKAIQLLNKIVPKYKNELPKLYERYQNGEILDAGKRTSPKYDNIVSVNPDMVFIYNIKYTDSTAAKLDELNIPYTRTGSYWENSIMGKTEWVKFYAAFYGKDDSDKVDSYFQKVWKQRNDILRKVRGIHTYPKVALLYWSSSKGPYVWGAQNFRPRLINEVKGEYVFNNIPGTGGMYMDKETFYEKTMNADVVILYTMGKNITTKEQLLELNPKFADFKAYKNGRFYALPYDNAKKEILDPAGVMTDYAKAIHPEVFGNDLEYIINVKN